jgi:hypothetical protein
VSNDVTVPLKTACATGGSAQPSGTVVAATGRVVVVVVVVVVATGFTQPTSGTVVTVGSSGAGGHNTGTVVVVVVVDPETTVGEEMRNVATATNKIPLSRRTFSTLVILYASLSSQSQQY